MNAWVRNSKRAFQRELLIDKLFRCIIDKNSIICYNINIDATVGCIETMVDGLNLDPLPEP